MAKPFTSHDGVDARGVRAEVWVQTGTGTVKELSENGKNVLVKMQVEGLKHPVQGWTSTTESIYPLLVEAKEQGREIAYRIESQRKQGVPRETPIAELRKTQEIANENTRSLFVGIDGTLSSEAVTNPAEDPHAGGRIPATGDEAPAPASSGGGFSVEQALAGLAAARQGGLPESVIDATAALALAAGASVEQINAAGVQEQATAERRPVQRVLAKEAAPYMAYNTDGRVNLGSYMVQAACGAESLAADLLRENALVNAEEHNRAVAAGEIEGEPVSPEPVNFRQAAALGAVLLDLADQVQVGTADGGRADRMSNSHTRARSFVYDAVKNRYPVPFAQGPEAQEAWKQQVIEEAVTRFKLAVRIAVESPEQPAQQTSQQPAAQQAPAAETAQQAPAAEQTAPQAPAAQHAEQAPAAGEQGDAQVHQIRSTQTEKIHVPVEGEEGFVAPTQEVLQRFAALALAAGFEATPQSPVLAYLNHKFHVGAARKVHGAALDKLVTWYEQQGEQAGAQKFRQHVLAETGAAASA